LSCFRIEGWIFVAIAATVLTAKFGAKKIFQKFTKREKITFLLAAIFIIAVNFFGNSVYLQETAKNAIKSLIGFGKTGNDAHAIFAQPIYVMKVFLAYGIFQYFVIGLAGIIYYFKEKDYEKLIPFFIVSPTFLYFINPEISLDHPWMLRRFVFSVIPALILYLFLFSKNFFKRPAVLNFIFFFLFFGNLIIEIPYILFIPQKNLLEQTEKLSNNFHRNDLVFIDRKATGDGFSMISGPMNFRFGIPTAYFINPEDAKKIDRSKFNDVYFIIPDKNLEMYSDMISKKRVIPINDYQITNSILDIKAGSKNELLGSKITLPLLIEGTVDGKIYKLTDNKK